MACRRLATQYGLENAIPPTTAPIQPERASWLLEQQWCCISDETTGAVSCDPQVCATKGPNTILRESGFLAWVNERSMQCILKVTGKINLTPHKEPGLTNGLQPSFCAEECYQATPSSVRCFQCLKNVLENPSSPLVIDGKHPCPALFEPERGVTSVDTNLVQEAMQCQACVAENAKDLTKSVASTDTKDKLSFSHEYNAPAFENIWGCVTGKFQPKLGHRDFTIVFMIIGLIV